ncbi:MAG: hypothetical protein JXB42_00595 [Deltaproteobacteria bacterium]|nr:hypothetical protein [Deltaproteobacteria bacterium]
MFRYPYIMINGHIVMQVDDRFLLLDTGAPTSLGEDSVSIGDRSYTVEDNYLGITADYLTREIGSRIDGLIGADVIADFTMTIDPLRKEIVFGCSAVDFPVSIPVDNFMGIPIMDVSVNGSHIRAFFDTGAHLSYINPEFFDGIAPAGQMEDFYPGVGRFTTDTFKLETLIGGEELNLLTYTCIFYNGATYCCEIYPWRISVKYNSTQNKTDYTYILSDCYRTEMLKG